MSPERHIRVRIAPSPTGSLHIGTARTALFNWLYAQKHGGTMILRIEDTDRERSKPEFEQDIIESLKWLGITIDEGPIRQSDRTDLYRIRLEELLTSGHAYYCFCSKEELEGERASMMSQGMPPRYSGKCRALTQPEVREKLRTHAKSVIRFKMPETRISFTDIIRGKIEFDLGLIGDIAIAKNIEEPLYNFAVVIDDHDMRISHVIRGEDHLANTPKQIAIQRAFGFPDMHYAHLPLILDKDRSKMSKRNAATAIREYREAGYLPETIINFIAFLGWHPQDDKEIFSARELVAAFNLERVQKAGAVFNVEKLDWLSGQYIRSLAPEELAIRIQEHLKLDADMEKIIQALGLVQERMKRLNDFSDLAQFLFERETYHSEILVWKEGTPTETKDNLEAMIEVLETLAEKAFTRENIQAALETLTTERGRGNVLWPLRAALSGKEASPGPFEIAEILGKKESLERINIAIRKLE
ncbi:MAG: glutamate--tRNA ligase [Patescibacteria group bacterium]